MVKHGIVAAVWYWISWLPHLVLLIYLINHPPKHRYAGDIGELVGISSAIGWIIFVGGTSWTSWVVGRIKKLKQTGQ